ncbi:MAG: hypothetical protein J0I07_38480 [Myxococcales bacterium]|nr:hypothetical protein [Myxococcales bacterium]
MVEQRRCPIVHTAGRFTVVRFERAAVVLDDESQSLYELFDEAAQAFDIVSDLYPFLPPSHVSAQRIRRLLRGLRREILGERILGPHESVGVDGEKGEVLFRRYPAPVQWRRSSLEAGASVDVAGALVRLRGGALLVQGTMREAAAFARAFRDAGVDAIGWDAIAVESDGAPTLRSRAWGEVLPALEVWAVGTTETDGLRLSRLSSERALLTLLSMARLRPSPAALEALASCAGAVPHFSVLGPSDTNRVAAAIAEYNGLS